MELRKKGVFFSTDALVALFLIFIVLLASYPFISRVKPTTEVHSDVLSSLSRLKVSEVNSPYVASLLASGDITNLDNSLLEQIGEFYAESDYDSARNLAADVLGELETNENIGVWYGSTLIFAKNRTPIENAKDVYVSRQFISGVKEGESATGFSARAFLESGKRTEIFYFGGYVGDGNLTVRIYYNGTISSEAELEVATNQTFSLFINNAPQGNFSGSTSDFVPVRYNIPTTSFVEGENFIDFRGDKLHIAGGFLKISYSDGPAFAQDKKHYLPGVAGLVNVYDGLTVPGDLNGMNITLHVNSSVVPVFFNIGNATIFNQTTNGEQTFTFDNNFLSGRLNYNSLSNKTTPIRVGLKNASTQGIVDVFSVADLSSSMNQQCSSCSQPRKLLNISKEAHHNFVEIILGSIGNRVGLVGYSDESKPQAYHSLSSNNQSLHNKIDSWTHYNKNCICCGINNATQSLNATSSSSRSRVMVVMGDGKPQGTCIEQNTGSAENDSIQAACDAYEDYGIVVYAVGFGPNANQTSVMEDIAECGRGNYYYSEGEDLTGIYGIIANDIKTEFSGQTIFANAYSRLYPDSRIEFNYNANPLPFGLVLTVEKQFDDANGASFSIPEDVKVVEAQAVSYSGAAWTHTVSANGSVVYDINYYGSSYAELGDPYRVSIPTSYIQDGLNYVNLTTATSPTNVSSGSSSNKVIYTVVKNATSFSPVLTSNNGCIWNVQFEDDSTLVFSAPSGASDYCYYDETVQSVSNVNDVFQIAVLELLRELDLDSDGKIDTQFSENDLQVSFQEITGIPFRWSIEVQARRWLP